MTPNPQDSAVALEVERAAFEAYARRDGLNVTHRVVDDGLAYVALATENAWQIWKASRRSMPDTRFAAWCIELLTRAESRGLHLDADKRAILDEARASLSTSKQAGAEVEQLREQRDALMRALEVIAVGDAADPVRDAGDELVALGYWNKECLDGYRALPAAPNQPGEQQ